MVITPMALPGCHPVLSILHPPLFCPFRLCLKPHPQPPRGDRMADHTTLLGGDHRPADARDEALFVELPHEADLSWVDRGWLSALGVPLENTPPTDPSAGELTVGLTGDMYYTLPGTPQKLDEALGDQLWNLMGWDEQDSVANLDEKQDSVDDAPTSLG